MDATCPFVKKIHKIVREQCSRTPRDYREMSINEGIKGWGNEYTLAVESLDSSEGLHSDRMKACIVAQTTFNYK